MNFNNQITLPSNYFKVRLWPRLDSWITFSSPSLWNRSLFACLSKGPEPSQVAGRWSESVGFCFVGVEGTSCSGVHVQWSLGWSWHKAHVLGFVGFLQQLGGHICSAPWEWCCWSCFKMSFRSWPWPSWAFYSFYRSQEIGRKDPIGGGWWDLTFSWVFPWNPPFSLMSACRCRVKIS